MMAMNSLASAAHMNSPVRAAIVAIQGTLRDKTEVSPLLDHAKEPLLAVKIL